MGSLIDLNDTLEITTAQGFPVDVFNLEKHQSSPVTIEQVKDRIFRFHGKVNPRIFQLDPVRVFFYHNIKGPDDGPRWLAWGEVLIQSLHIEKNPDQCHSGKINQSDPTQWVTSGTYKMLKVFDPDYQKVFTRHETPAGFSYF